MTAPHVIVDGPLVDVGSGEHVPVTAGTLRHLRRVLRLSDGARLSLTDGSGRTADAELVADGVRLVTAVVEHPAPAPRIVLAQALSKGRRAEDAVRVACELAVDTIVPVVAQRTQGRPDAAAAEALVARWGSVAAAALEQSRGARLAAVLAPVEGIGGVDGVVSAGAVRLVAAPGATDLASVLGRALAEAGPGGSEEVVVAIGPEGGWTPEELAEAGRRGWRTVGLGPTVLRTEHAGPVAVAVIASATHRWSAGSTATLAVRPSRSPDAL